MKPHLNFSLDPMEMVFKGVMHREEWLPVPEYEEYYRVSSFGRILSLRDNFIMKQWINDSGYLIIGLNANAKKKRFKAHRLVGFAFVPNPEMKPDINHDDFDKLNNFYLNLGWMTTQENTAHYYKTQPPRKVIEKVGECPIRCQKIIETVSRRVYDTVYQLADETGYTPKYLRKMLSGEVVNHTTYEWLKGQYTLFYKKRHEAALKRYNELKPIIYGVAI